MAVINDQTDPPAFVTTAWVKARYSIANSTMYLWIANKRLPAPVRLGSRAVRFRLADILEFEARLRETGSPASRETQAGVR